MSEFLDRQVQRVIELIVHTGRLTGPWQTRVRSHSDVVGEYKHFEYLRGTKLDTVTKSAFAVLLEDSEKVVGFIRKNGKATMFLKTNRTLLDDDTIVMLNKLYGYVHTPTKLYATQMYVPESILPQNTDTMHVWCITKPLHSCE